MTPTQLDAVLQVFKSDSSENSFAKGIPMAFVDAVLAQYNGKYRLKYRGPSNDNYKRNPAFIHKEHATSFAMYRKSYTPVKMRGILIK
jgi:hypothetical protein